MHKADEKFGHALDWNHFYIIAANEIKTYRELDETWLFITTNRWSHFVMASQVFLAKGGFLRLAVKPNVYWNLDHPWSLGWCPGTLGTVKGMADHNVLFSLLQRRHETDTSGNQATSHEQIKVVECWFWWSKFWIAINSGSTEHIAVTIYPLLFSQHWDHQHTKQFTYKLEVEALTKHITNYLISQLTHCTVKYLQNQIWSHWNKTQHN